MAFRFASGVALASSLLFAPFACRSSSVAPQAVVSGPTCDSCWMGQCKASIDTCNANVECKAISDCVTANSQCTNWPANGPYCDDDCIKVFCADQHPAGIALYKAVTQCDQSQECGTTCAEICTSNDKIQKCEINDLCDLAHPNADDCKCNPFDAGVDAAPADAGSTCSRPPTCPSAASVSGALGLSLLDPSQSSSPTGDILVTLCDYEPDRSADPTNVISAIIRFQNPDDLAGFKEGEQGFGATTTDIDDFGSPPVPAYVSNLAGQSSFVALIGGCIEVEVATEAPLAGEEALVTSMIPSLTP